MVSGTTVSLRKVIPMGRDCLGILKTPLCGNRVETIVSFGLPWAIDNGAFTGFDPVAFSRLLDRATGQPRLSWVACPDSLGDARRTLSMFDEWEPELRRRGFPVAFVGQDGQEEMQTPWERLDCFFIGGSTEWKLSEGAADLVAEAKKRGKIAHMGRVNSRRRLDYAASIGCDSVDGTGISRWGDVHLAKFVRWVRQIEAQPTLYS